MNNGSVILEIAVIAAVILLPIVVVILMNRQKQLESSGHKQGAFRQIGLLFMEMTEVCLTFFAKVLSFLLVGEWSYINEIISTEEEQEIKE